MSCKLPPEPKARVGNTRCEVANFTPTVRILFYSTLDQNGHLSPPKIGAKVAYISRESDLPGEIK